MVSSLPFRLSMSAYGAAAYNEEVLKNCRFELLS